MLCGDMSFIIEKRIKMVMEISSHYLIYLLIRAALNDGNVINFNQHFCTILVLIATNSVNILNIPSVVKSNSLNLLRNIYHRL